MGLRRPCCEKRSDTPSTTVTPGGVAVVRTVAPTFTWGKKERRDFGARFSARKKAFSRPPRRAHKYRRPHFPRLKSVGYGSYAGYADRSCHQPFAESPACC